MSARRWLSADLLITVAFLLLFAWVIWQARQWRVQASLFPVLAAIPMLALAGVKLAFLVHDALYPKQRVVAAAAGEASQRQLIQEEEADAAELDDVFSTASRATWRSSLGWLALFFLMLWALGLAITVPLFSLLYLLLVSREKPLVAVLYAAASWIFIYALFDQLLHVPLPTSALLGLLGS